MVNPPAGDTSPGSGDVMLGVAEVAAHLSLSKRTVEAYRLDGRLPPEDGRVGRSPWWWRSTIDAWHRNRRGRGWRRTPTESAAADGQPSESTVKST